MIQFDLEEFAEVFESVELCSNCFDGKNSSVSKECVECDGTGLIVDSSHSFQSIVKGV